MEEIKRLRTLGRPRSKWENHIEINLMVIDWNDLVENLSGFFP